jgi:hypothetical protein
MDYSEYYLECQRLLKIVKELTLEKDFDKAATASAELVEAAKQMKLLLLKEGS